tara:strand:- start:251 stop:829 length:579 start_codon:yes stop_codon:yes gene_type:complete
MKYENWIFDFDGTLIDENVYVRMYPEILKALYEELSKEEVDKHIETLPRNKFGNVDSYDLCLKLQKLDLYYDILPGYITESVFKKGVKSLLKSLKSNESKVIVATNSHRKTVELFLAFNDIINYVNVIWAFEDTNFEKDHQEYWTQLSRAIGAKPEESLLVSDSMIEILKARSAGFYAKHLGTDIMSLEELQ